MAATRTANVTEDGANTVVRFSGRVGLPKGPVSVREMATGGVLLTPMVSAPGNETEHGDAEMGLSNDKRGKWKAFFDLVDTLDVPEEYMADLL
jgi:hypothetical protein